MVKAYKKLGLTAMGLPRRFAPHNDKIMPELPEVETIKNDLTAKILKQKIVAVEILNAGSARSADLQQKLLRASFPVINRVGKLLILKIDADNFLLVHLKMTGQLILQNKNDLIVGGHSDGLLADLPNRHTRIILKFKDDSILYFNDLRKFGYWQIVNNSELQEIIAKYGPEPAATEFTVAYLQKIFKNKKRSIKAVLLDQRLIAGIGNIYADEILFASGVLPQRLAGDLTLTEVKQVHKNAKLILARAIKYRGTTFNNYRDSEGRTGNFSKHLKVYGRKNLPCIKCGQKIIKKKVAGRGTHYCAGCQK